MLDPREHRTTPRGPAERSTLRRLPDRAADGTDPSATALQAVDNGDPTSSRGGGGRLSLAGLYERFDAVATGNAQAHGVDFHQLILDRLGANQSRAEAAGWTACSLERDGGSGRLRLIGAAPSGGGRSIVPDWTAGVAAEALAASRAAFRPDAVDATSAPSLRIARG
jgi:hypothetical protein